MGNRELLEEVASLAGIKGKYASVHHAYGDMWVEGIDTGHMIYWNPLDNDAHAFKLAVDFGIGAAYCHNEKRVVITMPDGFSYAVSNLRDQYDAYTATRKAIVKAVVNLSKIESYRESQQ